jgi:hypothetical protein
MSLVSRANVISYERFLDVRQRRQAIAAASGAPTFPPADLTPASPAAMAGAGVAEDPGDGPPATRARCP